VQAAGRRGKRVGRSGGIRSCAAVGLEGDYRCPQAAAPCGVVRARGACTSSVAPESPPLKDRALSGWQAPS